MPRHQSHDARRQTPDAIPWDVAGRTGFLFVTLCALKLWKLAVFRRHLFEIHWRTNREIYDSGNDISFYLFAALVGLNLWQFAWRCSAGGARTVRAANALVLLAGAGFIFLTFQANGNDFLYPVINGILSWWDLRWYLSLDFFFQPPLLAVWMLVYAAIYYVLARTKREHLVLHLTAVFAAVYVAVCLHGLAVCKTALLTADCLGIACMLAGTGVSRSANWVFAIQPWLWFGFLFLLFQSPGHWLVFDDPEAATLWGWSIVLFGGLSVFAWRRNFAGAWLWLLPFAFTSFLLLINVNYPNALNYRHLLFAGLTLPRYFIGCFFIPLTLLVVATIYRRCLPKASLLWLDVVNLLLLALSLADLWMSQIMHIGLDWQAIESGAGPKTVWRLVQPYLPGFAVGLIMLVGLYAVFIGLWRRETALKSVRIGHGGQFVIVTFLLLGFVGDWFATHDKAEGQAAVSLMTSSPLFAEFDKSISDKKTFLATARQLGEDSMTKPAPPPKHAPRNLNVLLIFQESSYNKYLSLFDGAENTEPLLSKYKDRMELFPNFFSNFAGSIYARFATFTGLYPVKDYEAFTYHRVNVKSIFDVLGQNDYENSVFYSSYSDYTGFRDFLQGRGIKIMYDADTMPGERKGASVTWGLPEEETLKAIQAQIQQYATNHQKFFLTYIPVAPHNPFDGIPVQFQKHLPQKFGDYTPVYLDNLLYMDWVITSILDQLKNSGLLDNTLVIITDDHGEMLGQNGGPVGHGWAVTPALANIPLIIMDPGTPGYRINDTVGSQVDLLPTILDLLGISTPDDQLYQGTSLYSDRARADRTIYLNSFQQYGIIEGHCFIRGSRETDNSESETARTFAIVNDGAKTIFPETNFLSSPAPSIGKFDQFQENLLEYYSHYCQIK
jgi:hypothetical protein